MIKMHSKLKKSVCRECEDEILENDLFYFDPTEEDYKKKAVCLDCGDLSFEQLEAKLAKIKKSTADLSTPTKPCSNEDCSNQTSTRAYFCVSCYKKLPQELKDKINCTYEQFCKNRRFAIAISDLARVHYQCLPYLQ